MHPKLQKFLPQHLLSCLIGKIANSECNWLKNICIKCFLRAYPVLMHEAIVEDPYAYKSFNKFFTRAIKPELRPVAKGANIIVSPVDGTIFHIGNCKEHRFLEAKGQTYTVQDLLGPNIIHSTFQNGSYINVYLSPIDYHRVHMPISGTLMHMNYIPGKLFSVNNSTVNYMPNLFAHNERVVTIFQTDFGMMAVVLVGAMFVGSIETSWAGTINATHTKHTSSITYSAADAQKINLSKGQELGLFKMGSTVIVLLANEHLRWQDTLTTGAKIRMGSTLGMLS